MWEVTLARQHTWFKQGWALDWGPFTFKYWYLLGWDNSRIPNGKTEPGQMGIPAWLCSHLNFTLTYSVYALCLVNYQQKQPTSTGTFEEGVFYCFGILRAVWTFAPIYLKHKIEVLTNQKEKEIEIVIVTLNCHNSFSSHISMLIELFGEEFIHTLLFITK